MKNENEKLKSALLAAFCLGGWVTYAPAQEVFYTTVGSTLTENFDTLPIDDTDSDWIDNSILPSWYAAYETANTEIIAGSDGSDLQGQLYSYGVDEATDRAIGSLASSGTETINHGIQLINNTGITLTQFTLEYDGEQWRLGQDNDSVNSLVVAYQVFSSGTGSIDAAGYLDIPLATFNTPQVNTDSGAASSLDGNNSANRVADITAMVSSINWVTGDELWIRFQDNNDSGFDHGLAVDDFRFTAIPEPSAYAPLFGLAIWGITVLVRKQRKKPEFTL